MFRACRSAALLRDHQPARSGLPSSAVNEVGVAGGCVQEVAVGRLSQWPAMRQRRSGSLREGGSQQLRLAVNCSEDPWGVPLRYGIGGNDKDEVNPLCCHVTRVVFGAGSQQLSRLRCSKSVRLHSRSAKLPPHVRA